MQRAANGENWLCPFQLQEPASFFFFFFNLSLPGICFSNFVAWLTTVSACLSYFGWRTVSSPAAEGHMASQREDMEEQFFWARVALLSIHIHVMKGPESTRFPESPMNICRLTWPSDRSMSNDATQWCSRLVSLLLSEGFLLTDSDLRVFLRT